MKNILIILLFFAQSSFAQNMLTWSEDLTNSGTWIKSNITITADQIIDVNGQTTIDMITASSTTYNIHEAVTVTAGTQYTFSFYAQRGTMTDVKYSVYNATASSNIIAPTSYYSSINSSGITRINITFTAPAGCTSVWVYPARDGGSTGTVYAGDLQMIQGSSPGTYTKTTSTPSLPATTYYIASNGSDAANGTTTSTPWQTLSKINSTTFNPGDQILFNRGDTFYGEITVGQSGTSGSPITFGAYGTGANPIITGFTSISSWTNLGSNIWESAALTNTTSNVVMINGVSVAMGRYPNTGTYNTVGSATASSITDASLGATDWTGAEVVVKVERYVINRATISSQSGTTINFTALGYVPPVGYKYFIQNDSRTLDVQNEWYYNPSTKKLRIYSTTSPINVKSSQQDVLVLLHYVNYVTFDGVDFTGANLNAFSIGSSKHITIQNCNISYSGDRAIFGENYAANNYSYWLNINNCNLFNNTKEDIYLENYFKDASITNNTCKNTGLILGAESNLEPQSTSIQVQGDSTNVQYNTLDSIGYIGIHFKGNFTTVQNNFINHFCLNRDDGGGIYTVGSPQFDGQKVLNNIVINGKGSYEMATNPYGALYAEGIYLDDFTDSVEIGGNTIAYCGEAGIYLHQTSHINVHDNLCYSNNDGQLYLRSSSSVRNLTVDNNQFIATGTQNTARFYADNQTDVQSFGNFYNNYYARPIDDNTTIQTVVGGTEVDKTLAQWQSYSSLDAGSNKSPITITNATDLIFEYNATNSSVPVTLTNTYRTITGINYNIGSITLSPYSSTALFKTGVIFSPTSSIKFRVKKQIK